MKCAICHTDIKGRYLIDAWGQLICAEHKAEFCSSCGRFIASTDLHLADGRCLCPHCRPSVVSLPQHVEWVEKRVRTILSSRGITDIPAGIPIKIVTPNEMARLNGSRQLNLFQPGLTQTTKLMGLFMSSCKHTIYIFDYLYWLMKCFTLGKTKKAFRFFLPIPKGFATLVRTWYTKLSIQT